MKKTIIGITIATLLFSANVASATTTSTDQLIAQLQAQIVALTQKLAELKAAQSAVITSQGDINSTLTLIDGLREGMSGEQVKLLQATLANDPTVYPEGQVTGYYGKLTREAINRYKKKHGFSANGGLDKATIAYINAQLAQSSVSKEDDDDDDHDRDHHNNRDGKKRFCVVGDREAWGRGKHRGWEKIVLPRCKHIPGGNNNPPPSVPPPPTPTTTPDTIAPSVSAIAVGSVTPGGMTLTWTTNELATSKVYLGSTTPVSTSSAIWNDATLRTTHTATFTGLSANTTYYFVIEASDVSLNKTLATQGSFTTLAAPDTTAPVMSAFSVAPTGSTTGTVTWTTNEAASSRVYVSTSSPVVTATASTLFNAALVTSHSMSLTGLTASTTYYIIAESRDAANNVSTSSESMFMTTP